MPKFRVSAPARGPSWPVCDRGVNRVSRSGHLGLFGRRLGLAAEKVLGLAKDLAKQQLLELADAAWVERTPDGNVKLHQSVNLTAMMAGCPSGVSARPFVEYAPAL